MAEINEIVPRDEFRSFLEQGWHMPASERNSKTGRKPMDAAPMFKTLFLRTLS